jgi:uncharacterized protein
MALFVRCNLYQERLVVTSWCGLMSYLAGSRLRFLCVRKPNKALLIHHMETNVLSNSIKTFTAPPAHMEFPQEIEVWYIIPAVRRELARLLVEKGLTQRQVAKKLDVTEAAVSQYLSNKRGTSIQYPAAVTTQLRAASERIAHAEHPENVRKEILELCALLKDEKIICDIHKKNATVKDGCALCFEK